MVECSLVIPVHNQISITRQCLNTLLAQRAELGQTEIIVVDDASTDTTPEVLASYGEQIRVIRQSSNRGFAASCNAGAEAAVGQRVVFLNNDTLPQSGWLIALRQYATDHPQAAVVGSKLLFPNRTIQHAGVSIGQDRLPRHIYAGFPADHPAVNKSRRFQAVTAASMLVERQVFIDLGGFDLNFYNGYEDVDFCLRLGQHNREVHYCHESVLIHLESSSRKRAPELDEPNERLYWSRWADRVRPDDFDYYLADRLIQVDYTPGQAPQLAISPTLGVVDRDRRNVEIEQLLNHRSQQVFELIEETNRLYRETQELKTRLDANPPPISAAPPTLAPAAVTEAAAELTGTLLVQGRPIQLSTTPSGRLISILMPIKNGADDLQRLLPKLLSQKSRDSIEIVAIDSGSSDSTVQVLEEYGATVVAIEPHQFNHGLTRNLAARYAQGSLLVYINKKVLPANDEWLSNLIRPLDERAEIAGVCSRLMPRRDSDPLTYRDVMQDLNGLTQPLTHTITNWASYKTLSPSQLRWFINFHSVSMATRRQVMAQIPFRKMKTIGEDVLWAKEVLEAGYQIHFEPTSVAYHSHDFSVTEIFQRHVDDGVLNRDVVNLQVQDHEVLPAILEATRRDWEYLDSEPRLDSGERANLHLSAFLRRTAAILGQWAGTNYDRFSQDHLSSLSLIEHTKRRSSSTTKSPTASWTALPPDELRQRTSGGSDPIQYEASGRQDVDEICQLLEQQGVRLENVSRLLDFGCGSGRLLRWLREVTPNTQLYGCDIDPGAIAWIKTYFPDVSARCNNPKPPLPYPDGFYDLVISYAVPTLEEVEPESWPRELQRVTQLGAWLVFALEESPTANPDEPVQVWLSKWFTVETVTRSQLNPNLTLILARRS